MNDKVSQKPQKLIQTPKYLCVATCSKLTIETLEKSLKYVQS